jgi:hypothetical protein
VAEGRGLQHHNTTSQSSRVQARSPSPRRPGTTAESSRQEPLLLFRRRHDSAAPSLLWCPHPSSARLLGFRHDCKEEQEEVTAVMWRGRAQTHRRGHTDGPDARRPATYVLFHLNYKKAGPHVQQRGLMYSGETRWGQPLWTYLDFIWYFGFGQLAASSC